MFKPMLASDANLAALRFPLYASPKLDGIRATKLPGQPLLSRSLKAIPNAHVQKLFDYTFYDYMDGELIVGSPTSKSVYRDTMSGVMSRQGVPDVKLYVFDHVEFPFNKYEWRLQDVKKNADYPNLVILEQRVIWNIGDLLEYEESMLEQGYEGLILRSLDAPYKYGRSTAREGYLLKLKRFMDAEATIIGFEERMHNGNEATTNELGRTERSSHKANLVGRGDLGAITVRFGECTFNIGTGFDDSLRSEIWANRDYYLGKIAKFKYFAVGIKDAPRHPVFLGFRDPADL